MIRIAVAIVCLSVFISCSSNNDKSSQPHDIGDIQSMWQRADGLFDVLCVDGSREVVRVEAIRRGAVCNGGELFTQTFPVQDGGKIDLLIVMDDSASMGEYQHRMGLGLEPLLSSIVNTNWQIGVVTTSSACLRGDRTITRDEFTADPVAAVARFHTALQAGTFGSNTERGIYYAAKGLMGNCGDPAQKWIRDDSATAALVISDERNCGGAYNEGCPGQPGEFGEYFMENAPATATFYGLLHDDSNPECAFYGWPEPEEYWRLSSLTGGLWGNICKDDYEPFLETLSNSLGEKVTYEFELTHEPMAGTLIVTMDGIILNDDDYRLSGRRLVLTTPIAANNMELIVRYMTD